MAQHIIEKYGLQPHPEGGHFKQTYASQQSVNSPVNGQQRSALTQIYFLLQKGEISRFHKVLHDEVWHFYAGAPLLLHEFDGEGMTTIELGGENGDYHRVVQGGLYQGAESTGDYTLVGCTVAPGFDFADFSFIEEKALKAKINQVFPEFARLI